MRATAVSRTLDLRGCGATLPIARTAVAMAGMRAGELLEVLTTDRGSLRDLPVWCRATGNRLVEQTEEGGVQRFVIRKRCAEGHADGQTAAGSSRRSVIR
jgi:tRNA 2-thiouridine synthesizing protein A